jgi:hypothetical protein
MIGVAIVAASLLSTVEHPLQPQISRFMEGQKQVAGFQPTGLSRADYLKVVEGQVRALRGCQKPDGNMPDPTDGRTQFSSPCYAHCVATLAAAGVAVEPDLLESGLRAMDFSVGCLAKGLSAFADKHPDFYTYPVMLAFESFANVAPKERVAAWRCQLAAMNPAKTYAAYGGTNNNWTLVNVGGEYLRALHGLTDTAYVALALSRQRPHMTELGMYLEHGAPFAYDAFSRYYLTGMLRRGYEDAFYRDACWKGAWTSLLIQSPFGELPTGYRSSQHIWNEAELAKVYEIYAAEYAQAGRLAEAGAFKRGARLALASVKEWIRPDGSGYIVKNRYPVAERFGYEAYSVHVNYNLLACSMLCAAWLYADEAVAERPSPADVGGFVVCIPDFHMVVANAGGSYVQYMTKGNGSYNPTGLIRVHLRGGHPRLGYSDGLLSKAKPQEVDRVEVLEEALSQVRVKVGSETLTLNDQGVAVNCHSATRLSFPMLTFDGQEKTGVDISGHAIRLRLAGRGIQVVIEQPSSAIWTRTGKTVRHRNGLVEEAVSDIPKGAATYRIQTIER